MNVYAPTKRNEKEAFYKQLSRWLKKVKRVNDSLVLGGDWNCVQNASIDTRGMAYAYREVKKFKKLQKRFHLIDAWRKIFPFRKQYTWRQLNMNICSRLDFWLITDTLLSCVQTTEIKPVPICDHCAITLRLTTTSNSKGGGIWKMNNSLLKDDDYKEKIKKVIKKFMLENYQMNAQVKWDMRKAKIKEYTINISKEKHVEKNQIFKHLQNEYTEMSKEADENSSEENITKLEEIKTKLDKWLTYKTKGAFVRSRQRWMEEGEKSTKYFLQTEKRNAQKKEINCIKKMTNV